MKIMTFTANQPLQARPTAHPETRQIITQAITQSEPTTALQLSSNGTDPGESLRHILLGSPSAIQQTIHLLHKLHYAETLLWTPILTIEEPLNITPAQGEAISLLKKQI